jgi:glutamate synthase domain-containing protein 1
MLLKRHKKIIPSSKDISACGISGFICEDGKRVSGEHIMRSIANMHDRGNGLGGGIAAYGIYPDNAEHYAIHIMYDDMEAKQEAERTISRWCTVFGDESIPTRPHPAVRTRPILHRYFVDVKPEVLEMFCDSTEDEAMVDLVMRINIRVEGAFVFSSGRNMGVFKGVGYPEELGEFYRCDEYQGYMWTAHNRFPTNTSGWWGGAHPFSLLDWTVVHNGEISSYGINKRYLENFGYACTLQTDTEVVAYLFDLLVRRHELPLEAACLAMAPPFWSQIERMGDDRKQLMSAMRMVYGGALLNGPFAVLVGYSGGLVGFNDRTKLRPMVAARKGDNLYVSSEEGAIREICNDPDKVWHATAGIPVIGRLKEPEKILGAPGAKRLDTMTCTLTGGASREGTPDRAAQAGLA